MIVDILITNFRNAVLPTGILKVFKALSPSLAITFLLPGTKRNNSPIGKSSMPAESAPDATAPIRAAIISMGLPLLSLNSRISEKASAVSNIKDCSTAPVSPPRLIPAKKPGTAPIPAIDKPATPPAIPPCIPRSAALPNTSRRKGSCCAEARTPSSTKLFVLISRPNLLFILSSSARIVGVSFPKNHSQLSLLACV